MTDIVGTPRTYHPKFKFLVLIDGFERASFTTCDGLETSAEVMQHREGGALRAHKEPGLIEDADITLTRGATNDRECYDWMKEVVRGDPGPEVKRNVSIVQQDRRGTEVERWDFEGVFPINFKPGSWDNNSSEFRIEELQLANNGADLET